MVALVVGTLHLAWLSERFTTEQGGGGLTLLLGCTFTTAVLWFILMLRSLAADKPFGPELDDGVNSMAVTAWVMALVPPRASNFVLQSPIDDFSHAYLPVSLLVVVAMLGAQALWPKREERLMWLRFFASSAVGFWLLAGFLVFSSSGDDAAPLAMRSVGLGLLAALMAGVQGWRTRA